MGDRTDVEQRWQHETMRRSTPAPAGKASRIRMQAFPLLADATRLQLLCDRWFNDIVPPEIAYFRPALPMVFCSVLHYPEMSGTLPWRTGTLSQNEVYFLVPLERYKLRNGRREFMEYCATTPYILVDNADSAVAGRERFGMPKEQASFTTEWGALPWPVGIQHYLTVTAPTPTTRGRVDAPLLDIVRNPPATRPVGFDDDWRAPRAPWPSPATAMWLGRAMMRMAPGRWNACSDAIRALQRIVDALRRDQHISLFNLRQFPDANGYASGVAQYQDLVSFRMRVVDTHDFGLLSPPGSDLTHSLFIHRSGVRPIVSTLGLRATRRTEPAAGHGHPSEVDVVDALFPFYAQVDADLTAARTLCFRHCSSGWIDEEGKQLTPGGNARIPYNRYLGASVAAYMEEDEVRPLDFRILMLPARRDQVHRVVQRALPPGSPVQVTPFSAGDLSAVRVLFYRSRPRERSQQEGLMWQDGTYASISVPVHVEHEGETLEALLMIQQFSSNNTLVQGIRDINLGATAAAEFSPGSGAWFGASRRYTTVLSATGLALERKATGASVVQSPLLDVFAVSTHEAVPPAAPEADLERLNREIWPFVGGIQHLLGSGRIPSVQHPEDHDVTRVVFTRMTDVELLNEPAALDPESADYVVRFHENETYGGWDELGLIDLPGGDHTLGHELRQDTIGRTILARATATTRFAGSIQAREYNVLWESVHPRRRRPRP